jgi:F420-dependent oxidoreductase-like protein
MMRLSTQVAYSGDIKALVGMVSRYERVGLDIAWVSEAYGFDSPTVMGYLAAKTETVSIGSAIINIYSRTPALIAQTAAGLDAVSDGRAILGLGASGPQVIEGWHGVRYDRPLARTREIVDIVRRALRREVLTNDGIYPLPLPDGLGKPLKMLTHPVRPSIPIFVAALGDKNVALTAEIADGWQPILYVPEKAGAVWGAALAAGKAKRSPELGDLDVVAGGLLAIGDDVTALRDLVRPYVALYVGGMGARGKNFYNTLFQRYGYEAEAKLIQDLYLDGKKQEAAAAVPAEMLELSTLVGPAGYVRERIAAFRESGVTILDLMPIGDNPEELVAQVKDWVS